MQVCMVLGTVAEEVTQYAEDLEGGFKRALLAALKGALPTTLALLTRALESHFGQALAAAQQGSSAAARPHAAVVSAAMGSPCVPHPQQPLIPIP